MKPIVVHPRMDFMLYAIDSVVNEAAKWSSMMGGQAHAGVTIRAIINRGGEQGAQHSQALHAWFAHVPGLRVVMPSTVSDARDLLIASVLSGDPVMYIDDRWLYSLEENLGPVKELDLHSQGPKVVRSGTDVTLAGAGYSTKMCIDAAAELQKQGVSAEVIDIRVLNPFSPELIAESVRKTGRLVAVDGGWETAGFAGEVIASVVERVNPELLKMSPKRVTLPASPAPSSRALEDIYYPKTDDLVRLVIENLKS
jgi:pyruvate dehydrogenase E1 component beta subunit